jgi:hypothetical protein
MLILQLWTTAVVDVRAPLLLLYGLRYAKHIFVYRVAHTE